MFEMSQIGRGRSLEDQVKQLGAEIRALSNDLRRITAQREAAEAVNAAKQKQYEALMDEYKEITHKLQCVIRGVGSAPPLRALTGRCGAQSHQ